MSNFGSLCDDVIVEIILFLDSETIIKNIQYLNKHFYSLSSKEIVWKNLCERRFKYFMGFENLSLEELFKNNDCDWKKVHDILVFRVWDMFKKDDGDTYQGFECQWVHEPGTLFERLDYCFNNYYMKHPHYINKIWTKGKHGFVFSMKIESIREQMFGVISVKKKVKDINVFLESVRCDFERFDLNVRNKEKIFKNVDFYGYSPISSTSIHNFVVGKDIFLEEENLSQKKRSFFFIVLVDLDTNSMSIIENGIEFVVHKDMIKGPVVPVLFPFSDDMYTLYAIF